jgi:hypothetical protein
MHVDKFIEPKALKYLMFVAVTRIGHLTLIIFMLVKD